MSLQLYRELVKWTTLLVFDPGTEESREEESTSLPRNNRRAEEDILPAAEHIRPGFLPSAQRRMRTGAGASEIWGEPVSPKPILLFSQD